VCAHQLIRHQQVGVFLNRQSLYRIDAVARPNAVGVVEDPQVDAGAARCAAFDLEAGMPRAQLIEQ
jgi:hypothetical protein